MPRYKPHRFCRSRPHPAQAHVAHVKRFCPFGVVTSPPRVQSEGAVSEMLKAFAEIGPHINMPSANRSRSMTLAQPVDGVMGLANACAHLLAPVLADTALAPAARTAIEQTLGLVRSSVSALEAIAKPFQHETQMVAAQVDRMYAWVFSTRIASVRC